MDVDGVLTDGGFLWSAEGLELKRFCFADVTGISLAHAAGLHIALISGESSPDGMALVRRYATKVKIEVVYPGCHDKEAALREFAGNHGLDVSEVCFIGDDTIDCAAMSCAGLGAAPADAHPKALACAEYVAKANGGQGVVREVLDLIIEHQSREA
jgi:3-deoxy-D-manno-octulosonate 8-phosphate phosphatase (KDO 8-P phosphatase)